MATQPIQVELLLFGKCKDMLEASDESRSLIVKDGVELRQFVADVAKNSNLSPDASSAALKYIQENCLISINLEYYTDWSVQLKNGDEIAIIPPVSGG